MQWLAENWVIILLLGAMIGFHLFGHGHGGRHRREDTPEEDGREEHSAGPGRKRRGGPDES